MSEYLKGPKWRVKADEAIDKLIVFYEGLDGEATTGDAGYRCKTGKDCPLCVRFHTLIDAVDYCPTCPWTVFDNRQCVEPPYILYSEQPIKDRLTRLYGWKKKIEEASACSRAKGSGDE